MSKMRFQKICFTLALLLIIVCLQPLMGHAAPRTQYRITDLGLLPGGTFAWPRAINNHGHVVGKTCNGKGEFVGFLFRDGVMTEVDIGERDQGGYLNCCSLDINDSDQFLAQGLVGGRYHYFFITSRKTNDLNAETGLNLMASRLNNLGQVAGYAFENYSSEAICWRNGVVEFLGQLNGGHSSEATDINSHGIAIGTAYMKQGSLMDPYACAVLFWNGQVINLGLLPGAGWSFANALNDHGEVVGSSERHAFLCRSGSMIDLGALPGYIWSYAHDINNSGQVVGISEDKDENVRPFLYDQGVMYDLNDLLNTRSDWILLSAAAINDKGQIVGIGYHNGLERPFLLTPTKKPKAK